MKYHLKYMCKPEPGEYTTEDILEAQKVEPTTGATDALILISCLYPPHGGYSQAMITMDGRTGDAIPPKDLWKAWIMYASSLAEMEGLDESRRAVARDAFEATRAMFKLPPKDGGPA